MRGKGRVRHAVHRFVGITPACAGKRCQLVHAYDDGWDHPRVCGEKSSRGRVDLLRLGLPPRMRGKESHARRKRQAHGITPACAGKSSRPDRPSTGLLDHPRMCGEKASHSATLFGVGGSPPHVRGKVGRTLYLVAGERITPAYAGKSFLQRTAQCRCQDHPRVCGEKTKKIP